MGMFEGWAATMGGILDVAGIPGFLTNQQAFYDASATEGRVWHLLATMWWREFEGRSVPVSKLYELVRRECLPLDLRGRDEHAQRTSFGMQLRQQRDRRFGNFRIESAGELQGAQRWRLVEIPRPRRERRG